MLDLRRRMLEIYAGPYFSGSCFAIFYDVINLKFKNVSQSLF